MGDGSEYRNTLLPNGSGYFESNLFPYEYPNILNPSYSSYLPAYEDGTEYSETLACKVQTPGNYPEENIQHSEQGGSLKSRKVKIFHVLLMASGRGSTLNF